MHGKTFDIFRMAHHQLMIVFAQRGCGATHSNATSNTVLGSKANASRETGGDEHLLVMTTKTDAIKYSTTIYRIIDSITSYPPHHPHHQPFTILANPIQPSIHHFETVQSIFVQPFISSLPVFPVFPLFHFSSGRKPSGTIFLFQY